MAFVFADTWPYHKVHFWKFLDDVMMSKDLHEAVQK